MLILILFAFLAGIVTVLSPCILPVLPILLAGGISGGKRRPLGVIFGFILSFTFFTLFLSLLVKATGIPPDFLRLIAIIVIALFGVTLLVPQLQVFFESAFTRILNIVPRGEGGQKERSGFTGGVVVGASLGLVWTPCVGPILASVIALALTGKVTASALIIILSYAVGAAIPMLGIAYGGRGLLNRVPWLSANTVRIQRVFGVVMIATALAIYFNVDRKLQIYVLDVFPGYGAGLTKIEEVSAVEKSLDRFRGADKMENAALESRDYPDYGVAPGLIAGGAWFNSTPLDLKTLRGKVVLVDFWTYTCINCIRTLPYVKGWDEKYRDKGLVVIGVHTPEFEFEKDAKNVAKAIRDYQIKYPVMQDNNYATWNAYDNHYWPAKYLIDANGHVRYRHFGEKAYDETERAIRTLLSEAGKTVAGTEKNPVYSIDAYSPEMYLGYERMEYLAHPEEILPDRNALYEKPETLSLNTFAFGGKWRIEKERAVPAAGSKLFLRFDAKDVFLVMRPAAGPVRVKVLLDGRPVKNAGKDVTDSALSITSERLYHIIKLPAHGEHLLELVFEDGAVELYAFTFG